MLGKSGGSYRNNSEMRMIDIPVKAKDYDKEESCKDKRKPGSAVK